MKKGKSARRICLAVLACAVVGALAFVAACATDLEVVPFDATRDCATFNNGMTNIAAYSGDYTVGLTKTVGEESNGYIFSYNAPHDGQTDSNDGRLIAAATTNGEITSGVYFTDASTVYTSASGSNVGADEAKLKSNADSSRSTVIKYDDFTSLGWLPQLLVQDTTVDTVSSKEDITSFVVKVIEGVGALSGVDTTAISSDKLIVETNQYCEEFILEGGLLAYTMQFATSEASSVGCEYPSFTYLSITLAGQDDPTVIECYVSFDYAPANWNGPTT